MKYTATRIEEINLKGMRRMSGQKKNMMMMTRRKFLMFVGGMIRGTSVIEGIVR